MQDSYLAERVPSVVFVLVLCSSKLHVVVGSLMLVKFIFVDHIHIITKVRHSYPICSHYHSDGNTSSTIQSVSCNTTTSPYPLLLFAKMPRLTNLKRRKLKPSSRHNIHHPHPSQPTNLRPYANPTRNSLSMLQASVHWNGSPPKTSLRT